MVCTVMPRQALGLLLRGSIQDSHVWEWGATLHALVSKHTGLGMTSFTLAAGQKTAARANAQSKPQTAWFTCVSSN